MKNDGLHIIGTHKLAPKYIDKVSGMHLKWDRTCSLGGAELLKGDSEWNFEI